MKVNGFEVKEVVGSGTWDSVCLECGTPEFRLEVVFKGEEDSQVYRWDDPHHEDCSYRDGTNTTPPAEFK